MIDLLTDARYGRRKQGLIAMLDRVGDLAIEEHDSAEVREIRLVVSAPGRDLPPVGIFDYGERFERERSLWRLTRYIYEYREHPAPGRLAYHWHDGSIHAHCVERGAAEADRHFRAHEVTIFEAHEEFAGLFARGVAVTCEHLRPAILRETVRRYDDPTAPVAEEDWEASR